MAEPRFIPVGDRGGFAWLADPAEWMARGSSALVTDGGTIIVDPVDVPGLDERLTGLGPVAAVVQLLDRHNRDCAPAARRLGVPHMVPAPLAGLGLRLNVAGVREIPIPAMPRWREAALWLPDEDILVCAEAVGTVDYFLARDSDALGIHPLLRMRPPRAALGVLAPTTIVCGHGAPVTHDATVALGTALAESRREAPRAWARAISRGVRRLRG